MKQKVLILAALLALAGLFFAGTAWADSPVEPYDYTLVTEDGRYILVMLSHNAKGDYDQTGFTWPDKEIRAKYSQAGLYKNDGSTTPLWTIDWYAFDVHLSSDGQHLVQYGPWSGTNNYDELALAFHENGRLLIRYSVEDLVANPSSLPHSVSHYIWLKDASFDDAMSELAVETLNEEKYTFDVRTGAMIRDKLPPAEQGSLSVGLVVAFASVVVLIAVLFMLRVKRYRLKRPVESA